MLSIFLCYSDCKKQIVGDSTHTVPFFTWCADRMYERRVRKKPMHFPRQGIRPAHRRVLEEPYEFVVYSMSVFKGRGKIISKRIGEKTTLGHVIVSDVNLGDSHMKVWQEYLLSEYLYQYDKDFYDTCYGQTVSLHIRKKLSARIKEKDVIMFKRFGVFEPIMGNDRLGFLKSRLFEEVIVVNKEKLWR